MPVDILVVVSRTVYVLSSLQDVSREREITASQRLCVAALMIYDFDIDALCIASRRPSMQSVASFEKRFHSGSSRD